MPTLIQNALIPQGRNCTNVDVQITGDRITAIYPHQPQANNESLTLVNGENKLLLPGFVNGHTHSSQVWQRGLIPQLPLELWLADILDSTTTQLEQFYLAALSTAVDTLLSGGTCVMDHAYLVPDRELETVAELVKAYKQVGIRAFIAPLIHDQPFVSSLPGGLSLPHSPSKRSTQDVLALMDAIVQQFHQPEDGIYIAMGPTGFHRCTDELLAGCVDLCDRYQLCCHTHLLETRAQRLLSVERYGRSAVQHLQQLGFLRRGTSLAHSVWLNDQDIEILVETQSTVVHNPVSNLRLGSGIAPILKYRQAGVNISFGCDGAASNDAQNLLEVIKLGTILHTLTEADYQYWLTPQDALEMASLGGAKGVNLGEQLGSLEEGKVADVVLYDLNHPSMLPCADPVQLLVLGRPTDVVDSAWINGKRIIQDGVILTVDLPALRQEMLERSRYSNSFVRQTIHEIEPHYREVLRHF